MSVLAAALSACVVEPELLNSERIQAQFGSYGIDIISFESGIRRASLYSTESSLPVCRTYAIVQFDEVPQAAIGSEHSEVVAGASIGATFRDNGWRVYKETRYLGQQTIDPDPHGVYTLMRLGTAEPLAVHVYRLLLKKQSKVIEYATIIEAHHPDYLGLDQLEALFAVEAFAAPSTSELRAWRELLDGP